MRTKKNEVPCKTWCLPWSRPRKLSVPGEEEFGGAGVSYCATCDGAFFRDKTVAVVGGGDVAVEDAIFLARGCTKVYLIHRRKELRAAKILQETALALGNVEPVWDSVVTEICGEDQVKSLKIKNVLTEEERELFVDGCLSPWVSRRTANWPQARWKWMKPDISGRERTEPPVCRAYLRREISGQSSCGRLSRRPPTERTVSPLYRTIC